MKKKYPTATGQGDYGKYRVCLCGETEIAEDGDFQTVIYFDRIGRPFCIKCAKEQARVIYPSAALLGIPGCMFEAIAWTSLVMAGLVFVIYAAAFWTDDVLYWLWMRGLWEVR